MFYMNVLNNCFYSSFAFPMNQGSKSWSDLHLCKIIFICFNNRENYVIYCLGTLLWLIDFTRKVKVKSLSHVRLYVTSWSVRYRAPLSMGFSRQEYSTGLPFPSPGIFPTQGSNLGLQHCRQTFYHLSHQGSHPREW